MNPTVVHPTTTTTTTTEPTTTTTTTTEPSDDEKQALQIRRQSEAAIKHHHEKTKRKEKEADARVQKRLQLRKKAKQAGALGKCPSFSTLTKEGQARIVDMMEYKKVSGGKILCQEGDPADRMFLLMKGACSVTIGGQQVALLAGGDYPVFGESALFDDSADSVSSKFKKNKAATRTATVTAIDDLQVLVLKRKMLRSLVKSGDLDENCVKALEKVALERRKANALANARTGTKVTSVNTDVSSVAAVIEVFASIDVATISAAFEADPKALAAFMEVSQRLNAAVSSSISTVSSSSNNQKIKSINQPKNVPKYDPTQHEVATEVKKQGMNDTNAKSELMEACEKGNVDLVKSLLAKESRNLFPNVNQSDRGLTPLYMATLGNKVEVVKLLLSVKNINVNSFDKNGASCLYQSCNFGYVEIVKLLLNCPGIEASLNTGPYSYTPLKIAREREYKEIEELLKGNKLVIDVEDAVEEKKEVAVEEKEEEKKEEKKEETETQTAAVEKTEVTTVAETVDQKEK